MMSIRSRSCSAIVGALLLLPSLIMAQNTELRLGDGAGSITLSPDNSNGYRAYPLQALSSLGVEVVPTPRGARAVIEGDTLTFEALSPVFWAGERPHQLAAPAYFDDGRVFLPGHFFTEWLPTARPNLIAYDPESARLTWIGPRTTAKTTKRPATGAKPEGSAARDETRVVIIDPGHGGRDPGKIGPGGIREKDLTLTISRLLAEILREREGFEVHLTRTTDTLIALADRPHMANRWKDNRPAALFVSIHANSAANRRARGFETFFLSDARTEDERRVAEMENAAIAYEAPAEKAAATNDLDWIFNTLRNDFYVRASNDLAEVIQKHIREFHTGPDRGVKQAGFRVLVGAFMPAVLVETAFISNQEDAALLRDSEFQKRIALALADAIEEYFDEHEHLWSHDNKKSNRGKSK